MIFQIYYIRLKTQIKVFNNVREKFKQKNDRKSNEAVVFERLDEIRKRAIGNILLAVAACVDHEFVATVVDPRLPQRAC